MLEKRNPMKRALALLLALCLLCALPVPALAAEESAAPKRPRLTAVSMRLSSDFGMVFTVQTPDGAVAAGVYVNDEKIAGQATENAGTYTAAVCHIRAWEMTVIYTVTPYAETADGEILGDARDFSVLDYATAMMASPACTEPLREVLISMLNYGAAAQTLMGFNTARLANMNLFGADKWRYDADRTFPELSFMGEATTAAAAPEGATLVLSGKVYCKVIVKVAGQEQLRWNGGTGLPDCPVGYTIAEEAAFLARHIRLEMAADPSFENARSFPLEKCGPATGGTTSDRWDDCYYVLIPDGLFPTEYSQPFYFRIRTDDGTSPTFLYSVDVFAGRKIAGWDEIRKQDGGKLSKADRREERMVRALVTFGDAVRAYEAASEAQ